MAWRGSAALTPDTPVAHLFPGGRLSVSFITKKQYNEETHSIYNIDKTKTYNIKNNRYTDEN